MKKLYNNSYLIISLYLLFSFLIDILTNITLNFSFSAGMILRGMLLVYIIVGLLLKYKNKMNYYIIGTTGLFSLVYLLFHHNLTGLSYIFKFNFTIILFLFFYNLYTKEDKKINRNIPTLCLLFYALSIVLCWLLDIKLLYNSTHEISAIIAIVLSFIFVNLEKRINFIDILTIIISLFASILIGTRLPLITFLICMLYIFIKKLIKDIKNKKIYYTNIIIFALFVVCFTFKFKETPLCKNMIDHIKLLHLNNPIDVLTNYKMFDNFVFNQRLTFLSNLNKVMISAPTINKLFGLGAITKIVQMDLFDIFYRYGVIGFTLFIFIFTYITKKMVNRKSIHFLPIFIILVSVCLSGHVLLSPNVSLIMLVCLSGTLYKRKRKKILLASYDLGVGGIESALINFIKNINKDENEITVYLEHKKGELLKDVPNNVLVKQQRCFCLKFKLLQKILNLLNKLKFLITNYKEYDFSCCYATYSMSSNFLARNASNNNSIYIHSDYTQTYKNNIDEINKFFVVRNLDKFKHIIFVSNESKNNLLSIYPRLQDKSLVINNFIDNEKIINLSKEKVKETKPKGKKLFLFVGRLDEHSKNLTRLINSFELALKENKNIILWIVGSGNDLNLVKKLIKEKNLEKYITLLGKKTNPYPYFKMCDYVILTSNYEGFPVIYGEAITLNKPIITTIDVTDESISIPHNYGYICKKDEQDIANTITSILKGHEIKYNKANINEINQNKYELLKKII